MKRSPYGSPASGRLVRVNSPSQRTLRSSISSHSFLRFALACILVSLPAPSQAALEDTWMDTSLIGAPSAREWHTTIWTGSEMIVWGGRETPGGPYLNTGGRYDPATDTWQPTSTVGAPSARYPSSAIWTGSEMIVWGGYDGTPAGLDTGGRYDPVTDSWTSTSTTNAPSPRVWSTAVWTGSEMVVWGGFSSNTGGRYNPATDTWQPTSTVNVPAGRSNHTAIWTGTEMVVWGGQNSSGLFGTGGRYNPATDTWQPTSTANVPSARAYHTAIWTGSIMVVWGGEWNFLRHGRTQHRRAVQPADGYLAADLNGERPGCAPIAHGSLHGEQDGGVGGRRQ